jgi:hypothetical protein
MAGSAGYMEENARLKKELEDVQRKREQDIAQYEQRVEKERSAGKVASEQADQKAAELSAMRSKMVKLTRQLDDEVTRRDIAQNEAVMYQGKLQDVTDGIATPSAGTQGRGKGISFERERGGKDEDQQRQGAHASTKLMRVIEHWMTHKDLQQALLRNALINDMAFSTLVQVLADCPSLQTLDLAGNHLTMDSCSEICNLITSSQNLSFVSLADNLFSLRSLGYFMTAVMERQNTKKLAPLDLLDLHGNEGFVAGAAATPPEALLRQVNGALGPTKLPARGAELISQVMRALWRFLHETGHPQVRNANADEVAFHTMDRATIRKMESALMKILLLPEESEGYEGGAHAVRSVTADLIFVTLMEVPGDSSPYNQAATGKESSVHLPPIDRHATQGSQSTTIDRRSLAHQDSQQAAVRSQELRDPFSDLKAAFEPPKEKLKTFNLKQIVTRNGTVLMNMLERLLETTEIDAHDVETEQTLLEYACQTGNVGLAKLCYRRGANLSARTKKGDTAFNIVTNNQRYDIMEFLHKYGVKVNSSDSEGRTALHIAAG